MVRGKGPIVMRIENGYGFYEHSTIASAKAEARRLCEKIGGRFVVMVPVALIEPAPKTIETTIHRGYQIVEAQEDEDDELPF